MLRVVSLILFLSTVIFAQPGFSESGQRGYLIGPGDVVEVKVLGEDDFNFIATVDEDGKIQVPFFEELVVAMCKTERQLRNDITQLVSKYVRNPQVSVRVTERKSRPPATVYGEVRQQQQIILTRQTRLLEVLSFAGGVTEKAGGIIQIFRTQPPLCADQREIQNWKEITSSELGFPSMIYSLTSVKQGKEESNPIIYPGDIIIVQRASPVYVIGEVMVLREIPITENGLTLTEAIAQAGGFSREAKTSEIRIRRLKPNSKDREIITVNYDAIRRGEQKDILLQPEDIVEVGKSKKNIGETILDIVTGGARSFTQVLPQRVLY
ncbi:MAG: polysaccharide biosynthesis/export family protein [Pyrinomonadaceae bacterium]|nr:polysaccharide biosynthesis/export family protein [Pyrinomonadaceae bacterium]MCX7640435.1 polysaccharide biosynthesis/export family protein [Pyrinomonadaceae bacterium]MDW8304862.1 polysaccharide biosynthesis/export family protein [Acidobacteriota bacterium]